MHRKTAVLAAILALAALMAGAQDFSQFASPDLEPGECTALIIGKLASADGSVMTSHTCDGNYDSRLTVVPGAKFKPGETVKIVKDLLYSDNPSVKVTVMGEIPQVESTYTYFQIAYPFMNEFQVMIGETTIGNRREFSNPNGMFYIEQLEAIALQRGKTAREVVQIMGALAEKYGYADGGECLTVTDENEGWGLRMHRRRAAVDEGFREAGSRVGGPARAGRQGVRFQPTAPALASSTFPSPTGTWRPRTSTALPRTWASGTANPFSASGKPIHRRTIPTTRDVNGACIPPSLPRKISIPTPTDSPSP